MERKQGVQSDSFWGDLVNAIVMRPVYREPMPKPKVDPRQEHPDIPNGSAVRINSPLRPSIHGKVALVDAYWPLEYGGPMFTAYPAGAPQPGVYYFNPDELTPESE